MQIVIGPISITVPDNTSIDNFFGIIDKVIARAPQLTIFAVNVQSGGAATGTAASTPAAGTPAATTTPTLQLV